MDGGRADLLSDDRQRLHHAAGHGRAVGGRTELAGRAANLSGAVGLVLSGAFSIVSGVIYTGSFLPVTLLIAAAATLTAAMLPARPRG